MQRLKPLHPPVVAHPPLPSIVFTIGPRTARRKANMKDVRNGLLMAPDAAEYLSISRRYLSTLTKNRVIPCVKFGRRCVRYKPSDLDKAADRFRVSAKG